MPNGCENFNRSDSVHGNIGKKLRQQKEITNFDDLADLCSKASDNIEIYTLQYTDLYAFQSYTRSAGTQNSRKSL